jgi:hypothetical protein
MTLSFKSMGIGAVAFVATLFFGTWITGLVTPGRVAEPDAAHAVEQGAHLEEDLRLRDEAEKLRELNEALEERIDELEEALEEREDTPASGAASQMPMGGGAEPATAAPKVQEQASF